MSFTHTLTRIYRDTSGANITDTDTIVADTERNIDYQVAGSAANKEILINLTATKLESCSISSDQEVTVYTNDTSGGSPQDTILIKAGQNLVWDRVTDGAGKIPFAGDVTAFYITVTGSTAANFKFRSLSNFNV